MDTLTVFDARGRGLNVTKCLGLDIALAIKWSTEWVNDATE
jgi:hypothetical protein